MKKYYLLLFVGSFLEISNTYSQEEAAVTEPSLSVSGSVDAYFRANLSAPNDQDAIAPGTSFGNLPGFALGMVNLVTSYEGPKTGFVADLVFGPRGEDAVFASPYYSPLRGSSQIINQLYVYWKATDALTLSLGNFNTFLGYEVISPASNFNYSTSYMFSYGPFSHTGIKADLALSEKVALMLAVMNPTDATELNPIGEYTVGAQLAVGGLYVNFLLGDQDGSLDESQATVGDVSAGRTVQVDLTGGWDVTEAIYLGVNATYNSTGAGEYYEGSGIEDFEGDPYGFYGIAGYFQLSTSETTAIGTRLEYFGMYNGGLVAGDGSAPIGYDGSGDGAVFDITLTGRASIGGLTIIPELRLDLASENTFVDRDLAANKSLSSFMVAAVYAF